MVALAVSRCPHIQEGAAAKGGHRGLSPKHKTVTRKDRQGLGGPELDQVRTIRGQLAVQ
jgi:hypothetical protein